MAYGLDGTPQEQQDIEMSAEDTRQWWARIAADRARRDQESVKWKRYFTSYLPPQISGYDVNSNLHFRNTEQKKALLWAQLPELILTPEAPLAAIKDPQTQQPIDGETIVDMKREVLSKQLDVARADLMVDEALFDVFQTSGIGWTKICYQSDVAYPPEDAATEPTAQPGSILGLGTPPTAAPQPVVVNEHWRWYRFSAEKGLIPSDFHSTNYDEAPYLAMEFVEPLTDQARRAYNLPPGFVGSVSRDEMLTTANRELVSNPSAKMLKGVEIWLYACYYDPSVANSQVMRRLVLIDGLKDRPAIYRASPYQSVGPDGRLSPDSLVGNPLHPLVLRVASDMAYVPPDAAFTDPLVRNENTWMAQDLMLRDANVPRFVHPASLAQAFDKLKNMGAGQGCSIPDEAFQRFAKVLQEVPHLETAQTDVQARIHNQQAIEQTLGIGANQGGATNSTIRSATEVATIQANVSARQRKEQNELMAWFMRGVQKFDALLQRYMTTPGYVSIIGPDGAQLLQSYTNAHLQGRYAYTYHPGSQLASDIGTERKDFTDWVNFMAKSGWIDMGFVARRGALLFGFNPARTVRPPTPPPPPSPPPMNVSLALKAADLGIPEVQTVMKDRGIDLTTAPPSPQLQAEMLREAAKHQPHGGAANKADLVDKHHSEISGQQPGAPPLQPAQPMQQMPPTTAGMVQ